MKIFVLLLVILSGSLSSCSPLRVVDRVSDEVLRHSQINHSLELVVVDGQNINDIGNRPFIISQKTNTNVVPSRHTFIGALYPLIRPDEYKECLIPFAEALVYTESSDPNDNDSSQTVASNIANSSTTNDDSTRRTSLSFRSVQAVVGEDILLHPQYQNELTEIIGFIQQLDTQPRYYRLGAARTLPDNTITAPLFVANDTSYTVARIVCAKHDQLWHVRGFAINIYDLAENLFDTSPPFAPHTNRDNRNGFLR